MGLHDEDRPHVAGSDLVDLDEGLVLADVRVITIASDLYVDNSAISGDPEPVQRQVETTTDNYLASDNIIFYGTVVVEGSGTGVVVRTGEDVPPVVDWRSVVMVHWMVAIGVECVIITGGAH